MGGPKKGSGVSASSGRGQRPAAGGGSYSLDRNSSATAADAGKQLGISGLTTNQLGNLIGAPSGASLHIQVSKVTNHSDGGKGITVSAFGKDIGNMNREIFVRNGKLVIYNNQIQKAAGVGPGFARASLDRQIRAARKAGVSRIEAFATGRAGGVHNGYYTLPRLGYDGKIPAKVAASLPKKYAGAMTVQQLFSKPGGDKWWKRHGSSFAAHIDL